MPKTAANLSGRISVMAWADRTFRSTPLPVCLALLIAVGCSAPGANQTMSSASLPSEEGAPQYGGLLWVPARTSFTTKDPYNASSTGAPMGLKARPVYEPLVAHRFEPETDYRIADEVVPWLARSWEVRSPTEYVFDLQPGIKWQDGHQFTAQDVVATFKYVTDPGKAFLTAAEFATVKDVQAEGKQRVRITLKGPDPDFLGMKFADKPIIPAHVVSEGDLEKTAVGTGPFKMVTLDNTRGITFTRNDQYWKSGFPYPNGIVAFRGLDDSGMIAAMTVGKLDFYNPKDKAALDQLTAVAPTLKVSEVQYAYSDTVFLRLDRPPFNDDRVRRALHLSLDRERLGQLAFGGKAVPATPGAQPGSKWAIPQGELLKMPGLNPEMRSRDVEEGKRLLKEAGFSLATKLSLSYPSGQTVPPTIAEPLATVWRESLGLNIELKPTDNALFDTNMRNGAYDLALVGAGEFKSYPNYYKSGGIYARPRGMSDPELDQLINTIEIEADQGKRQEVIRRIQRTIIDRGYGILTVEPKGFVTWQPWVKNYLLSPGAQVIPFYTPPTIWLDQNLLPEARRNEKLPF